MTDNSSPHSSKSAKKFSHAPECPRMYTNNPSIFIRVYSCSFVAKQPSPLPNGIDNSLPFGSRAPINPATYWGLPPTPSSLETNRSPATPEVRQEPRRAASHGWLWFFILLLIGAAAYYYFVQPRLKQAPPGNGPQPAAGSRKGGAGGVIPVVSATAQNGNIGVYYTGLGAVTPIYTVTIKSRVDGQLMKIHYKESETVHEGDLLVEIDPRPYQVQLEQAEGQQRKDQATLDNAKIDLARYQKLWSQNAIPQQQLATQEATVKQDEGVLASDQGQIDSAKLNLIYCQIKSPITGRIGLRLMDPGNIVHANDPTGLLVITQVEPISVIFTIAEDQLPPVLKKMRAGQRLLVEAWDRELKNKITQGSLATHDNQIDQTTGTLKLRAVFDNKDDALFPNQFVNARLLIERKTGVTLVPNAAVQRNSQNTFVYVVKPDQTVTVRQITLGVTEGAQTEIASGLAPGEVVVTEGVDKLQEGTKVNTRGPGERPPQGKRAASGKNTGKAR
jgi:multidrug efflux system membrane fusion protein